MSKIAIATGLILIVLGLAGYFMTATTVVNADGETSEESTEETTSETTEKTRSVTALIPMFAGIPIMLFGLWGFLKPESNKHAMHGAVLVATLGALAATGGGIVSLLKFINADGDFNQRAFMFTVLMGGVCFMFVIACVKSFIDAGKARKAAEQSTSS